MNQQQLSQENMQSAQKPDGSNSSKKEQTKKGPPKPVAKPEVLKEFTEKIQESKPRKKRSLVDSVNYYGIPLVGIALFFIVLLLGTIPAVNTIVERLNEIQQKKEEIDSLNSEITSLKNLKENESQILSDLSIIEEIIPSEKTQVAKFVGEIQDLAKDYDLEESEYASGEEIEEIEEKIQEKLVSDTPALIHIPTSSNYIAVFGDIEDFLNALYTKDDFIIMSELDMQGHEYRQLRAEALKKQGQDIPFQTDLSKEDWTMDVTFEKYQFSRGFTDYVQDNLVSIRSVPDEDTIQFIRERYGE